MAYWMLFERQPGEPFGAQFGSTDKSDVDFERQDRRDHGVKASDLKITRWPSTPDNAAVEAEAKRLNSGVRTSIDIETGEILENGKVVGRIGAYRRAAL